MSTDSNDQKSPHYLHQELLQEIKTNDAIFEFLQSGSLDGVWYWDLENPEHEWMSPDFWRLFGHDPTTKAHLVSEWQDMIHPDDLQAALKLVNQHLADPTSLYDQEVRYRHLNGSWVWVRCRGLAIRDADGQPRRFLGAHTDITALKNAQHQFKNLYEGTPALLYAIDLQGRIVNVTDKWLQHFGYTRDEVLGQDVNDFMIATPSSAQRTSTTAQSIASSLQRVPHTWRCKDGSPRDVLLSSTQERDPSGNALRVLVVLEDVTEFNQLQRALEERTELLTRSNQDLERFAYSASHDLREPLRKINVLLDILKEDELGRISPEGLALFDKVQDAAQRMGKLIDGLLTFSRVSSHNQQPQDVPLQPVVEAVIDDFARIIHDSGAVIAIPSPLPVVQGHQPLLGALFQNLIGNALKFTREGDAPHITVTARRDDSAHHISVCDHGIGIDPQQYQRVFKLFHRLHPRDQYQGTGIGLALCQRIVQQHNGAIEISETPGGGATFTISLPIAKS